MNTLIWVLQSLTAFVFLYSGINKSIFSEQKLVSSGQTGVEGLPLTVIRFIGISEILGAIGLVLPCFLNIYPVLTPISAIAFGVIMLLAGWIHYQRKEFKSVGVNAFLFIVCLLIAYYRL